MFKLTMFCFYFIKFYIICVNLYDNLINVEFFYVFRQLSQAVGKFKLMHPKN